MSERCSELRARGADETVGESTRPSERTDGQVLIRSEGSTGATNAPGLPTYRLER